MLFHRFVSGGLRIDNKRNASEGDQSQPSDARTDKPEPCLVGFCAVYVFDRLSRDLRLNLCAPEVIRKSRFRKPSTAAGI
jgi:hypothetical protein